VRDWCAGKSVGHAGSPRRADPARLSWLASRNDARPLAPSMALVRDGYVVDGAPGQRLGTGA
jgi:hypothetical protein